MNKEDYIHKEALKFRKQKTKEFKKGTLPKEHIWIFNKLKEMFDGKSRRC